MAGKKGISGRPPEPGRIYYLGRFRFIPGVDEPEIEQVLKAITEAKDTCRRRDIIRAALLSGAKRAQQAASATETTQMAGVIDDMFLDF